MKRILITASITLLLCIGGFIAYNHIKWDDGSSEGTPSYNEAGINDRKTDAQPSAPAPSPPKVHRRTAPAKDANWYTSHATDFIDVSYRTDLNLVLQWVITANLHNKADNVSFSNIILHIQYQTEGGSVISDQTVRAGQDLEPTGTINLKIKQYPPQGAKNLSLSIESATAAITN
jgi:hypothetical protein